MSGAEFVLGLIWVAVGMVIAFFAWSYIAPQLPSKTA